MMGENTLQKKWVFLQNSGNGNLEIAVNDSCHG